MTSTHREGGPPSNALGPLIVATVIAGVVVFAAAMARPMVTYRALDLGASPSEIGLVQSAYAMLPMLTAISLGRYVDRIGEARVIGLGCVSMTVGALLLASATSLVGLATGQILVGFGTIATAIATQAFVASWGPADRVVYRFGWFSVAVSAGQIAGPALAAMLVGERVITADGLAAPSGESSVFLVAALLTTVTLGIVWALPTQSHGRSSAAAFASGNLKQAMEQVLRRPGIVPAMLVSLVVASALDVIIIYLPAYGDATGLTVSTVGALLALRAGATLVARAFMSPLADRLGLRRTLVATTGLAAISIGMLPVVDSVPMLFVLIAMTGFGLGIGQPLTVAWVGIQSPVEQRGLAFGVRHTGNLAMLVAVPIVMGAAAGVAGVAAIWPILAVMVAAATLVAARTRWS